MMMLWDCRAGLPPPQSLSFSTGNEWDSKIAPLNKHAQQVGGNEDYVNIMSDTKKDLSMGNDLI